MSLIITYKPAKKPDHYEVHRSDWPANFSVRVKEGDILALRRALKIIDITFMEKK